MKHWRLSLRARSGAGVAALLLALAGAPQPLLAVPAGAAADQAGLDLARYRGKVVYVDFWASWCAPCHLSFGYMNMLRRMYSAQDLVIVTVNLDRDPAAAAGFLRMAGGALPVVYDPKGALATRFGVGTMPTSFLIGRDGRQRFVHRGYFENRAAEYSAHVATLVAERN